MVAAGWGRFLDDVLRWRSCRGVGSPGVRRRHPTRIWTPAARTPKSAAAVPERSVPRPVPMLIRSRGPGHSRRLARPPKGASRFRRLGVRGRRRGLVPGGGRWAGECVSVTPRCHSSMEWPAMPCSLVDVANSHEPVSPPPSSDAAGSAFADSHGSSPRRVFGPGRNGRDRRPIQATGCPRSCLRRTPRTGRDDSMRYHSPSTTDRASSPRLPRPAPVRH